MDLAAIAGAVGPCCVACNRNYWESCRPGCVGGYVNNKWPKPMNDWVLIKTDPLPEQRGSILLPNKGEIYTATVLAVGPGAEIQLDHSKPDEKRYIPTSVKPGEKVAFLRWVIENLQNRAMRSTLEDLGADIALIKERDILFILEIPPGEKIELSL